MTPEREADIREAVAQDSVWAEYNSKLMEGAEQALSLPLCRWETQGVRQKLLKVSREYMRRMLLWGYAYRFTGDTRYVEAVSRESLNVASFDSWNPKHFLDVSEMTTGMAIAYDWMYDALDEHTRSVMEEAIVSKGIEPSFDERFNSWLKRTNNWNQVCNGGMTLGALAVRDRYPELSDRVVKRSVESVKLPMRCYGPDGAYPEGYMYWSYGTSYNIMMLDALTEVYGTDFGLSETKGFMQAADYIQNMVLGDGVAFNYGDCENKGRVSPGVFWFASHNSDPTLLWQEKYFLQKKKGAEIQSRYATMAIIWGAKIRWSDVTPPQRMMWWTSGAVNPMGFIRTDWHYGQGLSIAIKGGSAQSGHCHLDAGSFIFTERRTRWAMDLGPQSYDFSDAAGLSQWDKGQDSDRWRIFRYNNLAHNTLSFDGNIQNAEGYADVIDASDGERYVMVDLSDIYKYSVSQATRTISLGRDDFPTIVDEITTGDSATTMRWNMVTMAEAKVAGPNVLELSQDGKVLRLEVVEADCPVTMRTWSAEAPNTWDMPTPEGVIFVGFESTIPADSHAHFKVRLYR